MHKRMLIALDPNTDPEPVLARAEKVARKLECPIHLVCFIDISSTAKFGPHGPVIDIARYRDQVIAEHGSAYQYLKSVAQELKDRGFDATYEVRTGLLAFELPAAVRQGDLIVTASQQCLELPESLPMRPRSGQDLLKSAHRPSFCP